MSLTTDENGSVTLGKERHQLCMEAAWELEALGYLLPSLNSNSDFVVRGVAGRVVTLAEALMSALHEEAEKTSGIARTVHVQPYMGRD